MKKLLTAGAITAWSLSLALGAEQTQTGQPSLQQEQQQETQQHEQREQPEFGAPGQRDQDQHEYGARDHGKDDKEKANEYGARDRDDKEHQKLSKLEDAQLKGADGEDLGEFEDVVIDLETGAISFIIVADENDERRPVPISAVEVSGSGEEIELTMNIDQQEFQQGPTVGREEIAQLGQEQRAREIFEHYGESWEEHQQQMEFAAPPHRDQDEDEERDELDQQHSPQLDQDEAQAPGQRNGAQQPEFGAPGQRGQQDEQEGLGTQPGQQQQQPGMGGQQDQQHGAGQAQPGQQDQQDFGSPGQRGQQDEQEGLGTQRGQQQPGMGGQQDQQHGAGQAQQPGQTGMSPDQDEQETEFRAADYRDEGKVKLGRDLKEATVTGSDQQQLGEISDVLLDLEEGKAAFVLIEADEVDGTFAVSPRALEEESEGQFRLNISQNELEQAESISQDDLQQRAQQQEQTQTAQLQQSPEVFRYEDEDEDDDVGFFGSPQRDQDEDDDDEIELPGQDDRSQR